MLTSCVKNNNFFIRVKEKNNSFTSLGDKKVNFIRHDYALMKGKIIDNIIYSQI